MLLKVLFYGYLNNIYSCRKIAKAMTENIHYMLSALYIRIGRILFF